MDKKDKLILDLITENCRLTTQQMSKKLHIPITTIHNRIKKLEEEGVIKGYKAILNNKKIGKPIAAYVLIMVDYKMLKEMKISQHELAKRLRNNEFVEEAAITTGRNDIIIKVRVSDIDQLDNFVTQYLRNINGIDKTETMVILNED